MAPDVTKGAGSGRDFKRQTNSLVNSDRPSFLPRLDFLEISTGRWFVTISQFTNSLINCCLIFFTQAAVGFVEAR